MKPYLTLAVCMALAAPVSAQARLTQLQQSVASELPNYGYRNVDVRSLDRAQLAQINHLLRSGNSVARIRGQVGAIIRGTAFRRFVRNN